MGLESFMSEFERTQPDLLAQTGERHDDGLKNRRFTARRTRVEGLSHVEMKVLSRTNDRRA